MSRSDYSDHDGVALAALTLGVITLYHLTDYMRGPMGSPYYTLLLCRVAATFRCARPTMLW